MYSSRHGAHSCFVIRREPYPAVRVS
jgi:hypothetical protein